MPLHGHPSRCAQVRRGDCDPLYGSIPYLIIERGGSFVGILIDSAWPVFMDLPGKDARPATEPESAFVPVAVSPDRDHPIATSPALVIELRGAVVRIAADASPALVTATLRALRR